MSFQLVSNSGDAVVLNLNPDSYFHIPTVMELSRDVYNLAFDGLGATETSPVFDDEMWTTDDVAREMQRLIDDRVSLDAKEKELAERRALLDYEEMKVQSAIVEAKRAQNFFISDWHIATSRRAQPDNKARYEAKVDASKDVTKVLLDGAL